MFIQCSSCNSKYLVNSADLKPNGRLVECANCTHQWYQELKLEDDLSVKSFLEEKKENSINTESNKNLKTEVKNLPSTIVKDKQPSLFNSILVILILISFVSIFWLIRSYGINLAVIIDYYIKEFYFNLKLIINDIAKIIYQILN